MEISRTNIKNEMSKVCAAAKISPVFMTHYNRYTEVIMSKEMFDEWKAIVDAHKSKQTEK